MHPYYGVSARNVILSIVNSESNFSIDATKQFYSPSSNNGRHYSYVSSHIVVDTNIIKKDTPTYLLINQYYRQYLFPIGYIIPDINISSLTISDISDTINNYNWTNKDVLENISSEIGNLNTGNIVNTIYFIIKISIDKDTYNEGQTLHLLEIFYLIQLLKHIPKKVEII